MLCFVEDRLDVVLYDQQWLCATALHEGFRGSMWARLGHAMPSCSIHLCIGGS